MTITDQNPSSSHTKGPVRTFWSWWTGELAGLITLSNRSGRSWKLLAFKTADRLTLHERRADGIKEIGALTADTAPQEIAQMRKQLQQYRNGNGVILRLGADNVLLKTLSFPQGTRDVIEPVLRNQMARLAPWPEAETRFGYALLEDDELEAGDQLKVDIVATSNSILNEALALAGKLGLKPNLIDYGTAANQTIGITLSNSEDTEISKIRRLIGWTLAALFAVAIAVSLGGIMLAVPKQALLSELETQISAMTAHGQTARQIEAKNAALRKQQTVLINRKTTHPSIVMALEELSRKLPDTTSLTSFELRGFETRFTGRTTNAASLIALLENSKLFTSVEFSAPTTRENGNNLEIFSIKARSVPGMLDK